MACVAQAIISAVIDGASPATARSFILHHRPYQQERQPIQHPRQRQVASVLMDLVVVRTSINAKDQALAIAVVCRDSVVPALLIVKLDVRRRSGAVQTRHFLLMVPAEVLTNTNAKVLVLAIAAALQDTAAHQQPTVLPVAKAPLVHALRPTSHLMALVEAPKALYARGRALVIAAVARAIAERRTLIVPLVVRARSEHVHPRISHLTVLAAVRTSTSVKDQALVIAAVHQDIVVPLLLIVKLDVKEASVSARLSRLQRHLRKLASLLMAHAEVAKD